MQWKVKSKKNSSDLNCYFHRHKCRNVKGSILLISDFYFFTSAFNIFSVFAWSSDNFHSHSYISCVFAARSRSWVTKIKGGSASLFRSKRKILSPCFCIRDAGSSSKQYSKCQQRRLTVILFVVRHGATVTEDLVKVTGGRIFLLPVKRYLLINTNQKLPRIKMNLILP